LEKARSILDQILSSELDNILEVEPQVAEESVHDKGVWTVPLVDDSSLTLQATVGLVRELALHEVDLKDELLKEKELKEQAFKEIDQLRAELGHPKIYEKLN
jgi:hypothetical protein